MPRVSEDHLAARRRQIIDAARVCFLRNGLHATSMQDLIREADLSVGAVYRYFKSKTDIVNAIAEDVVGNLNSGLGAIVAKHPGLPLVDAMDQALRTIEAQLGPDGAFRLALQIWAEAMLDPAIAEIVRGRYAIIHGTFRKLAQQAYDAGELPADADIDGVASVLFGMVPGFALQRALAGRPDRETYLAGIRALLGDPPRR